MASQPIITTRLERFIRRGLAPGFVLLTAALAATWLIVAARFLGFALYPTFGEAAFGWAKGIDAEDVLKAAWHATPLTVAYIAALVGYHKFGIFREGKPHITIDLSASGRPVSDEHNHVGVTARIHNTSKVAVPVANVEWELAVIAPYSATEVLAMETEFLASTAGDKEFPWRWHGEPFELTYDMIVEPNEVEQLTFDFIVPNGMKSCVVSLFIENVDSEKDGWYRRLFYDISLSQLFTYPED